VSQILGGWMEPSAAAGMCFYLQVKARERQMRASAPAMSDVQRRIARPTG